MGLSAAPPSESMLAEGRAMVRALADGTLALFDFDGHVSFYLDGDEKPPTPLGRVHLGMGRETESMAVPGCMALVVTDTDARTVVLGVRRAGRQVEVCQLALWEDALMALPFFILDEDGRENRFPSRPAMLVDGFVNDIRGIEDALADFERWPRLSVEHPAVSTLTLAAS